MLRVLLLEDSEADAELIGQAFRRANMTVVAERVDCKDAFTTALQVLAPDVVLSEHSVARFDPHSVLDRIPWRQ
jgi:chemotaxis response regulator CheB